MLAALPPATPITSGSVPAPSPSAPSAPVETVPVVVQRVTVTPTVSRTDLLTDAEQWAWEELRDYVVAEITRRFGAFPRDARKEYGIFNSFVARHGADAAAIAQYAFGPILDGWWGKAPISINRFAKNSDPYFAAPILARLNDR